MPSLMKSRHFEQTTGLPRMPGTHTKRYNGSKRISRFKLVKKRSELVRTLLS
jgi:hypothetical protein